ncbi:caspase domain-containing protein [Rhodocollybia butyracea]|uniref:Caspase domain-containing protein n=1 Tax=Rhodocollybia butyracea TaxID=206335 RepID=A0A9P5TVI0_9AGAR|nr:caspase domain-containing protein [Rhodocollybia butyracea]
MSDNRLRTFDNLWALVIGIEEYESITGYDRLQGPGADVDGVEYFLLEELQVPEENVLILRDGEATRDKIIDSFETHFINNKKIPSGSALLFYYSGHGGRLAAPKGWPVLESVGEDNRLEAKVEVLIPSDCVVDSDENGRPTVQTIPDRTINSLLLKTAQKHGDNITVILDCCFSAHLNRISGKRRDTTGLKMIPENFLPKLLPETDAALWGRDDATVRNEKKRGGIAKSLRRLLGDEATRSHVLLAACSKHQQAWTMPPIAFAEGSGEDDTEDAGENGSFFTTFLLQALGEKIDSEHWPTYSELIREVQKRLHQVYLTHKDADPPLNPQDPEASGWLLQRPIFKPFEERRFETTKIPGQALKVHAGHIHAVAHDTEFSLFDGVRFSDNELARDIRPSGLISAISCTIKLPSSIDNSLTLYASIVSPGSGHPLKTRISPEALAILRSESRWSLTIVDSEPDIIIETRNDGLIIRRLDRFLRNSPAEELLISKSQIAAFRQSIDKVALFNFHLHHEPVGSSRPYCHDMPGVVPAVEVNIGEFQEAASSDNMMKVEEALFCPCTLNESTGNSEIRVDSQKKYGVVIRNNTQNQLFFSVVFFDPYDYSVMVWYQPTNDKAYVLAGGTLQLGQSSEMAEMLEFDQSRDPDIGFMKVYISHSYTDLHSLNQDGFETSAKRGHSSQLEDQSVGEEWDCLCFTVISTSDTK